jgi:hypothetical protein
MRPAGQTPFPQPPSSPFLGHACRHIVRRLLSSEILILCRVVDAPWNTTAAPTLKLDQAEPPSRLTYRTLAAARPEVAQAPSQPRAGM